MACWPAVDLRTAAELCLKLAEALHHAHEAGVVHRDLKPTNIIIDSDNEPHVMDFGLAKREAGDVTMTMEGKVLGTPAYMSPEQARGEAHRADRRSDVYSLGVILYELLTEHRPFRGNIRMLLKQVIEEDPPSPRKLNSSVPPDMETICLKCLEKDPDKRYTTARDLADEFQRFLKGEPIHARPISKPARAWRWCKRNPTAAVLGVSLFALMLILGVGGPLMAMRQKELADAERSKSQELEKTNADLQASRDTLARTNAELARKTQQIAQTLLDQAFAAAMSGNTERTLHVLATAKDSGASEVETELILGVLKWASIELDAAVPHLRRVTELDPTNVAAKSTLAMLALERGATDEFFKQNSELKSLTPQSPIDFLMKANAVGISNPWGARKLTQRALDIRESPMAHVMHAIYTNFAGFRSGKIDMVRAARSELIEARTILGSENNFVETARLTVLMNLAILSSDGENGEVVRIGEKCAADLLTRDGLGPLQRAQVAFFYDRVLNDLEKADQAWQRVIEVAHGDYWQTTYAAFKLRTEGLESAIETLDSTKVRTFFHDESQLIYLALHPDGRDEARELWREFGESRPVVATLAAVLLGELDAARQFIRSREEGAGVTLRYLVDEVSDTEHFERSGEHKTGKYSLMGIKSLALGKQGREKAREYFLKSVAEDMYFDIWYFFSKGFLAELDREPDWPNSGS